jgi:hypothetical protein
MFILCFTCSNDVINVQKKYISYSFSIYLYDITEGLLQKVLISMSLNINTFSSFFSCWKSCYSSELDVDQHLNVYGNQNTQG